MSKTLTLLTQAYVGESQARNRYTFYASNAKKEGYEQISKIFLDTADNEREHASWFLKMIKSVQEKLGQSDQEISVETTVSTIRGTTLENLKNAVNGETHEYRTFYPEIAKVAASEGYKEISARVLSIAVAEKHHSERYQRLAELVETNTFFKREEKVWWVCRECGYVYNGKTAPESCPSCGHLKSFYQILSENF